MPEKVISQWGHCASPVVGIRGIHLDLKGLAPTFERLLRQLELYAAARYNLILVEWEDMFPWVMDPQFRHPHSYSTDQIGKFVIKARQLGLEIVPLVQSLGHLEMVLSWPEYQKFREIPDRPDCLNPLVQGASELVIRLIDEVLELMPEVRRFHLGGDEAYCFGQSPESVAYIGRHGRSALYRQHIEPLLAHLNNRGIRPMLWADMMADWSLDDLCGLGAQADLVAWGYQGDFITSSPHSSERHIAALIQAGCRVWGAAAYKGADGFSADLPNPLTRRNNLRSWLEVAKRQRLEGIIMTGWSRHSSTNLQCEPPDAALNEALIAALMLYDGDVENLSMVHDLLADQGELERFELCCEVMKQIATLRADIWLNIQSFRHNYWSWRNSRYPLNYHLQNNYQTASRGLEKMKIVGQQLRRVFSGLLFDCDINAYLHERIAPLEQEIESCGWLLFGRDRD